MDAIQKARLLLDSFDRLNRDWSLRKVHPLLKVPCGCLVGQVAAGEFPSTYANKAEITLTSVPSERAGPLWRRKTGDAGSRGIYPESK